MYSIQNVFSLTSFHSHSYTISEHITKWFLICCEGYTSKHLVAWYFLLISHFPRVTYLPPTKFLLRSVPLLPSSILNSSLTAICLLNVLKSSIRRLWLFTTKLYSKHTIQNITNIYALQFKQTQKNKQKKPECTSQIIKINDRIRFSPDPLRIS